MADAVLRVKRAAIISQLECLLQASCCSRCMGTRERRGFNQKDVCENRAWRVCFEEWRRDERGHGRRHHRSWGRQIPPPPLKGGRSGGDNMEFFFRFAPPNPVETFSRRRNLRIVLPTFRDCGDTPLKFLKSKVLEIILLVIVMCVCGFALNTFHAVCSLAVCQS